jgi:hypothetical protein
LFEIAESGLRAMPATTAAIPTAATDASTHSDDVFMRESGQRC